MLRVAIVLLLLVLAPSVAQAQKRVALVIGNSAYQHTAKLANPKNDAADVAAALKTLGFHVVEGRDLDKTAMERKLRDFATGLSGADVGIFFYAGHEPPAASGATPLLLGAPALVPARIAAS